jgi:hypothetical protein
LSEHCIYTNFQYNGNGVIPSWNYIHVGHKNSRVKISNIKKMVYSWKVRNLKLVCQNMYTAKQTGILCSGSCNLACHNVSFLLSMVYWLGINHVQFPAAAREFSVLQSADWLWGPLSLLFSGYWGQSGWGMKLNVYCQLMTRFMHNDWSYTYTPPHMSPWCAQGQPFIYKF